MKYHLVFYDAECPLCRTVKAVIVKLDWFKRLKWLPVQTTGQSIYRHLLKGRNIYDEIHMLTSAGKLIKEFDTVRKILSVLPLTFPVAVLLYLPFIPKIGNRVYQFISKNRYQWFGRVEYNHSSA
jgi:predicted DCC family thiol-disulfide oxidoreductase YuxK